MNDIDNQIKKEIRKQSIKTFLFLGLSFIGVYVFYVSINKSIDS